MTDPSQPKPTCPTCGSSERARLDEGCGFMDFDPWHTALDPPGHRRFGDMRPRPASKPDNPAGEVGEVERAVKAAAQSMGASTAALQAYTDGILEGVAQAREEAERELRRAVEADDKQRVRLKQTIAKYPTNDIRSIVAANQLGVSKMWRQRVEAVLNHLKGGRDET